MSDDEDLFGSDLEIDDGPAATSATYSESTKGKDRLDTKTAGMVGDDDLFGSDEEAPEPAPVKKERTGSSSLSSSLSTVPGRVPTNLGPVRTLQRTRDHIRIGGTGTELCAVKVPTWMRTESIQFSQEALQEQITECEDQDLSHLVHTIRWRMTQDEQGHSFRESNTRLVTWSDGSIQMLVGSLVFDVVKTKLPPKLHYLFDQTTVDNNASVLQQYRAEFATKLLVKPTHNAVAHVPKRRHASQMPVQTTKKIVTTKDPEQEVEEKIRQHRLQTTHERARERTTQRFVPPPADFSADFLEYSDEDEDYESEEVSRRMAFDDRDTARRLQDAKIGDATKGRAIIKQRKRKPEPEEVSEESAGESDREVEIRHKKSVAVKRRHVIEESDSD